MASTREIRHRKPLAEKSPQFKAEGLREPDAVKKVSGRWIRSFLIAFLSAIVLSCLVLCLLPSPINPVEMSKFDDPPALTGVLEPNNILSYCEKIYTNQLFGPESIVVDGDYIYTGTADGWVNAMHNGVVTKLVKFGKEPCGGYENENTCGRPLGMRMGKDGFLVVLDAYYGLFKVNVVTGEYTILYSSITAINGKPSKLLNDLDIGSDEKIYFTDSSTRWNRNQFPNIIFEGAGTGRLLMYDPVTKEVTELIDGLVFANGVQLTNDKMAVLVAETSKARILKYDLKTKQVDVWVDNLPGLPDNVRYSKSSGTYWVGLGSVRHKGTFSMMDFLADKPWIRGMLAKVTSINGIMWAKKMILADKRAMALELNNQGTIVRSIQDKTGEVFDSVSEVEEADGVIYIGSYHATYIGRLYKKRFPGL